MTEYRVLNPNPGPCSLIIYKPLVKEDGMTVHNYKRQLRSASMPVTIPARCSVDLIKVTGLTLDELKNQKDLYGMLQSRKLILLEQEQVTPIAPVIVEEVSMAPEIVEKLVEVSLEVGAEEAVEEVAAPVEEDKEEVEPEDSTTVIKHRGRPKKH